MDNNSIGNSELSSGGESGLEFEIGGGGLVFDDAEEGSIAEPVPEAVIDLSGVEESSSEPVEFFAAEAPEVSSSASSSGYYQDAFSSTHTYIPRFTEVSERYRMSQIMDARQESSAQRAAKPEIDPTSDIDEEKEAPHVVVVQSVPEARREQSTESIMILKFDTDEGGSDNTDPEELEVTELTNVVLQAARPEAEEPEEVPAAQIGAQTEAESQETTEEPSHSLPDPFVDLTLIDYNAEDTDSESLSAEDAPSESGASKRFGEFEHSSQQDSIKDRFLDKLMSIKIRLFGAIAIFAVLLAVNILKLFSIDVLSFVGIAGIPFAAAVVDLQFSVCLLLFAFPEIIRGIKNIFGKTVSPELAMIPSIALVAVHDIAVIIGGASVYPAFGILFGIQVIFAILASYHRVSADFATFKIISKNTVKSVLDKRLTRTLPRENLALDGAVDEYKSKIARMFSTAFISDFFSRTSVAVENSFNTVLCMLVSLGASVATAIITFFVGDGSFVGFMGVMTFVFLASFPAFSMLIHKLPHHMSSVESRAESSAFVGESSLYNCTDIDVIAYDDTEIFGEDAVTIKKVHLYGKGYNASKAMEEMNAIFSVVGGPLSLVFADSVDGRGKSCTDITIEEDGISGMLDGKRIFCGTLEYMQRHEISIPEDDYKTNVSATDSTKVMYGAEGDSVYVKFFIRYSFSEEFTMLLPGLKAEGIVPLIYTRDPNLTVEFFKMLTLGEDLIRVMKKYNLPSNEKKVYRRVSAGIVTLGNKLNAINMVLLAKKYTSFQSGIAISELFSMLAGCVVGVVFAFSGSLVIPAIALGALQLAWCAYLYLRSLHAFKHKKDKGNN